MTAASRWWRSRSAAKAGALDRRDAIVYVAASAVGSFGLGVAGFYLNFLYRALGFDELAIGLLAAALALGGVAGAVPAWLLPRVLSRRAAVFAGGGVTALGLIGILAFASLEPLLGSAALLGAGGIVVSASGYALIADATSGAGRTAMFGRQAAIGTAAAFLASFLAGALAAPVAAAVGLATRDPSVLRLLIGGGGLIAAASALPALFIRAPRVARGGHAPRIRGRLLLRFLPVELLFGFGAGSFLPFVNLFFADRFSLDLGSIGLALGLTAAAGSAGALLHARLARRTGPLPAVVLAQLASLPFAVAAALAGSPALAAGALAARAGLMYGASATYGAFQHSSFAPAERAGAHALFQLAWGAGGAVAAVLSGLVRATFGPAGYTLNLATLVVAYALASCCTWLLFHGHEPRGDALAHAAPHSPA